MKINPFSNFEFNNLIQLIGSDTTLVHKNIARRKHNICYEAKLLSVFSQPKSKPRKVICHIGPKQVKQIIDIENAKDIHSLIYTYHFYFCAIADYHKRENSKIYSKTHCNLPLVSINQSKQLYWQCFQFSIVFI